MSDERPTVETVTLDYTDGSQVRLEMTQEDEDGAPWPEYPEGRWMAERFDADGYRVWYGEAPEDMLVDAGLLRTDRFRLENSREVLVNVHPESACAGEDCPIHNRSDHAMRSFPQHWRGDRGLMERICPHGVGHPDPDHLSAIARLRGSEAADVESIHGCDGCCTPTTSVAT